MQQIISISPKQFPSGKTVFNVQISPEVRVNGEPVVLFSIWERCPWQVNQMVNIDPNNLKKSDKGYWTYREKSQAEVRIDQLEARLAKVEAMVMSIGVSQLPPQPPQTFTPPVFQPEPTLTATNNPPVNLDQQY